MESNPLAELKCSTAAELAQHVFKQKAQRRLALGALPVEEKYLRFLQLQRMVAETLRAAGKPCPDPWPFETAPSRPSGSCDGLETGTK